MRKTYVFIFTALLALFAPAMLFLSSAQGTRTITGRISDNDTGEPVAGVSVIVEGTVIGVISDGEGNYSIKTPAGASKLKFDCLGYLSQTRSLPDKGNIMDIRLLPDTKQLDEVVVTALGITRKEKSLGYSVAKLSADELDNSGSGNWLSGASGKVAGLNIDQSTAGPDGSVRVTLRGENSLSYNNNTALFVVDGVPVSTDSESNGSGSGYQNDDAPVDYGGGSVDLNPDDIESIVVLKGPAATALYGSKAANGAIVITTKKARDFKGIGVTYNGGFSCETADYWPEFQYEYGAGDLRLSTRADHMKDGITPDEYSFYTVPADKSDTGEKINAFNSRYQYGEKVEGQMRYMYASYDPKTGNYTRLPYRAYNLMEPFFQTGLNFNNGVTIEGNTGKGSSLRISFKDTRNKWIVPNTGFDAQTVSVNGVSKRLKVVDLGVSATYYGKHSDNLPMSGYNDNGIMKSLMWLNSCATPEDVWNEYQNDLVTKYRRGDDDAQKVINSSNDNPYAIAYQHLNTLKRHRVYGNVYANFHILNDRKNQLDLLVRGAMNLQTDFRTQRRPYYSRTSMRGMYKEQTTKMFESNIDFLLSYNRQLGNDFQLKASFGGNMMNHENTNLKLYAAQLLEPDVYSVQNVNGTLSVNDTRYNKKIYSLYGFVAASYKDMVFLEVTGRNDWSSTLAPGHNSYFYPSVNASVLLDKVCGLGKKAKWVDMIKVFGTWANVGNDTDPYKINSTYNNSANFTGAYSIPTTTADYYIKPENVESWEVGFETSFLKKRIGVNATYYDTKTTNQIINLPQTWASGAASTLINAGCVRNRGVELSLHFIPVDMKNFQWTLDLTWAYNKNTLEALAPGVTSWQISSLISNKVFVYGFPGGEMGRIYGMGTERAPEGAFYVDEKGNKVDCSGMEIVNAETGNPVRGTELKDLGSIYPDWTGGINTSFRWKGLSLSASFSASYGAKAYSLTNAILSYMGKTKNTLAGRYGGLIHEGVNLNPDGTYSKNTTITTDIVEYYNLWVYNRDNIENNIHDASYFKLKELRLAYKFPAKILKKTKVFKAISISAYATNVFCITNWPQFDPEVVAMSGNSLYRGVETGAMPMTRCYGVNLKLGF